MGIKPSMYNGKITIEQRREAINSAKQECKTNLAKRLVMWTDGSFFQRDGSAGGAVIFKRQPPRQGWFNVAFALKVKGSIDTELFAIAVAMHCAHRMICRSAKRTSISDVVIYIDCKPSLREIRRMGLKSKGRKKFPQLRRKLLRWIAQRSLDIQLANTSVELRWVPARAAVAGHAAADAIARQAARIGGKGVIPTGRIAKLVDPHGWSGIQD